MDFYHQVYELVRNVPYGRVATYGQIAALVGSPRAARMVGTALRALHDRTDVPWHRVISGRGIISIENLEHPAEEQANLLLAEGVIVSLHEGVYVVDLKKYQWHPGLHITQREPL